MVSSGVVIIVFEFDVLFQDTINCVAFRYVNDVDSEVPWFRDGCLLLSWGDIKISLVLW